MRETLKLINKRTEINENELREERGAGIKRNVVMNNIFRGNNRDYTSVKQNQAI